MADLIYNLDQDVAEKGITVETETLTEHLRPIIPVTQTAATHFRGMKPIEEPPENFDASQSWVSILKSPLVYFKERSIIKASTKVCRKPITRTLESCPEGYPRLGAYLDCDENFMLYRRFGFLQARILLYRQDELRSLEQELDHIDRNDKAYQPEHLNSREIEHPVNGVRGKLIREIEEKFKNYAELLVIARDLASFNPPPTCDYMSVKNYFDEQGPVCASEAYIYHKEDIITLKPGREHSWLDVVLETVLQKLSCDPVHKVFSSPEIRKKTNRKKSGIILFSRERINFVVSLLLTITILSLLVIPIYILSHLMRAAGSGSERSATITIIVLLVFTMLFSGVLVLFTRAKRHEILSAAAAYCAVLVVFIGNVGQISTSNGGS